MSFDLDDFVRVHEHDSDRALLLASLAEMESGTSGLSSLEIHASLEVMARYLLLVPRSSVDTPHTGIHGAMARGQGVEVAEIDSVTGRMPFEAAGTACVAAARMMLTAETDMEYGWSHCLTLSEAAWGFVDRGDDTGTVVALSYVTGFVSALGFPGWPSLAPTASVRAVGIAAFQHALASASPEDAVAICLGASEDVAMQAWGEVVSQASDMKDAHLVKYIHAALRCATRKPEAEPIFLAAATRLLARWLAR